jgi:hypothetical protein
MLKCLFNYFIFVGNTGEVIELNCALPYLTYWNLLEERQFKFIRLAASGYTEFSLATD